MVTTKWVNLDRIMMEILVGMTECPICLETMSAPVRQCTSGHSICQPCTVRIDRCPLCKASMSTGRNYQLEKIIATLKEMELNQIPCKYAKNGCNVKSTRTGLFWHELECRSQDLYICEGKKFANWSCEWKGPYESIRQHFRSDHNEHTWMQFQTSVFMKTDLTRNLSDIQLISFNKELFWYKHKLDVAKQQAYWLCQYVGPITAAIKYFYEFSMTEGPYRSVIRKELCQSDGVDADHLINEGKCFAIPFSTLHTFMSANDEIKVSFKIQGIKNEPDDSASGNVQQFIYRIYNTTAVNPQTSPPNAHSGNAQQMQFHPNVPNSNGSYGQHTSTNLNFNIPQNFSFLQMPTSMPFPLPYPALSSAPPLVPPYPTCPRHPPASSVGPIRSLYQFLNE